MRPPFTFMEKRKHWGQRSDANSVHRWLCWIRGLSGSIQKKLEQAGIKNGNGGHKNGDDQRA